MQQDDNALDTAVNKFIEKWGEMATNWGISKTMGQIYALLFSNRAPLDTDEIMERLDISRGNANMNLRSLLDWKLVKKVSIEGSRKEYFEAERDMHLVATVIIRQRQTKELEPINNLLNEVLTLIRYNQDETPRTLSPEEKEYESKILDILNFLELFSNVSMAMLPLLSKRKLQLINKIHKLILKEK